MQVVGSAVVTKGDAPPVPEAGEQDLDRVLTRAAALVVAVGPVAARRGRGRQERIRRHSRARRSQSAPSAGTAMIPSAAGREPHGARAPRWPPTGSGIMKTASGTLRCLRDAQPGADRSLGPTHPVSTPLSEMLAGRRAACPEMGGADHHQLVFPLRGRPPSLDRGATVDRTAPRGQARSPNMHQPRRDPRRRRAPGRRTRGAGRDDRAIGCVGASEPTSSAPSPIRGCAA